MIPVMLRTERLVLDQPADRDAPLITEYCQDPLFEHYLTTPWPYEERHSRGFVTEHVPEGWANESEFTWAIRAERSAPLLGVVSHRTARSDIGFWLGAPHRGHGFMPEAVNAVLDWAFARGAGRIEWECIAGNTASATVARKCGFRFTGAAPGSHPGRDGEHPLAWHGGLAAGEDRTEKDGWPT
jgi:RimJ/RimL family protein N-acetyltransferase